MNQTDWVGDAPNPTSVKIVSGKEEDVAQVSSMLERAIREKLELLGNWGELKKQYMSALFRLNEVAQYAEREVSVVPSRILIGAQKEAFEARIVDVTEQGELVLQQGGEMKKYHFKEIQFVL